MSSEAAVLGVTLNRDRLNGVAAPESFVADGEFAVALRNEGEPIHVHLRFDGPIGEVASVSPPNHYVDRGATRTVRVSVAPVNDAVDGTLGIVVGHGTEQATVPLRIDQSSTDDEAGSDDPASGGRRDDDPDGAAAEGPRSGDSPTPAADPSFASAAAVRQRLRTGLERARAAADASVDREVAVSSPGVGTLAVGALAAAALVGAGVVAATLDGLAVTLGVVAVCVAVLVAGFLLLG